MVSFTPISRKTLSKAGRAVFGYAVLVRFVPTFAWSLSVCMASFVLLIRHTSTKLEPVLADYFLLLIGAVCVQGIIAHAMNDLVDAESGTDAKSPAILSGGSRVLQRCLLDKKALRDAAVYGIAIGLAFASYELALFHWRWFSVTVVALICACTYSLPPLRLSYRPLLGEWFCAFPTVFTMGVAGPWIELGYLPRWAYDLALVHALLSVAWLMVHHIPDVAADLQAEPKKWTTVAWCVSKFKAGSCLRNGRTIPCEVMPACCYWVLGGLVLGWRILPVSIPAGVGGILLWCIGLISLLKANPRNVASCTRLERGLISYTVLCSLWLGASL